MNRLRTDVFIIWVLAISFFRSVELPVVAEPPPWNVSLIGHIGGFCSAVQVDRQYVYIREGPNVTILDVSDPSSPLPVGSLSTGDFYANDIQIQSGTAFVAGGTFLDQAGLKIVDVANPRSPSVLSFYPTPDNATGLCIRNSLACVAWGSRPDQWSPGGVCFIDVSDRSSPTLVGVFDTPWRAWNVCASEDIAYVAGEDGLHIVDIADPSIPRSLAFYDQDPCHDVFVSGGLAYTATDRGLDIVDVTSPTAPTRHAHLWSGRVRGLCVSDSLAFVAQRGIGIVDITSPSLPTLIGQRWTLDRTEDVAVSSGTAYLADRRGGLAILDVTDPSSPALCATYDTLSDARDVVVADGVAYVANGVRGLKTIDVSNPRSPRVVGSLALTGGAAEITVSGSTAFVCDNFGHTPEEWRSFLHIVDVTTPSSPHLLGSYVALEAWAVAVLGELAYVAHTDGFDIVDVSDPTSPTLRGSFPTPGWESDICVTGDLAFVADYSSLQIIDVSNPTAPFLRSSYPGARVSDVFVSNGVAYISGGTPDFACIDVTNPDSPRLLGEYALSGWIYETEGLHVSNGLAYVFMDDLRVLDVSDPTNPTLCGYFPIARSHFGNDVFACGGLVYLASWSGLRVFQYTGGDAEARRWRFYR